MKACKSGIAGFIISVGCTGTAFALPFTIDSRPWRKIKGQLEVVDPGTGKVLSTTNLEGAATLSIDFPSEGLYYLQVQSNGRTVWRESLYMLTRKPEADELLKASWTTEPGVMRTVLKVQDPSGELRYGVSIRDKIFLRLRATPRLVRAYKEEYSGALVPISDLSIAKVTEKQAREENLAIEPDIQIDPLASDDDQAVYEPEWKGLLAGKEDKSWRQKVIDLGGSKRLVPLNRPHRVYGWLRILQEKFSVRRGLDTYNGEKSQGFGTGLGGDFVYKDTMSLQFEIDTHGTRTQYEKGGTNTPSEEQRRIHTRFGPLLDILNVEHAHPRFAIEAGPVIGYSVVPFEKDNEGKTDLGGSLRWQYFGKSHAEVQVRFMKSHSYDFSALWIGSAYKIASVNPLFGLYTYHTEFTGSDSKSSFEESGVRFGIHREL